jgi:hypothetical protein
MLLATAAAMVASPALARDGAVYVGAELGAMKANDSDIDVNGVEDAITAEIDGGGQQIDAESLQDNPR